MRIHRLGLAFPILIAAQFCGVAQQSTWIAAAPSAEPRFDHSASVLPNGNVLVTGGVLQCRQSRCSSTTSVEIYNAVSGAWTASSPMSVARARHFSMALLNGKILIAGGLIWGQGYIRSAEIFDPETGAWSPTGSLPVAPDAMEYSDVPQAVLLQNGKVLAAGGEALFGNVYRPINIASIYDPVTGAWSSTQPMNSARRKFTLTLLPDGRVLAAGGIAVVSESAAIGAAEIYDPATGAWSATGFMLSSRFLHTATLLESGKVLVAGGRDSTTIHASAEIYDPATDQWTAAGTQLNPRYAHTATLLASGKVLVAGGVSNRTTEIFDPSDRTWTASGNLIDNRQYHTATALPNGKVLIVGGSTIPQDRQRAPEDNTPIAISELFGTPNPGTGAIVSVSAASFTDNSTLAPESFAAAFGSNLSTSTAVAGSPFPVTLAGLSVQVKDSTGSEHSAPMLLVSPGQVNFLVPPGTSPGAGAVMLNRGSETVASGPVSVTSIAPGLFSADGSGRGLPAANVVHVRSNGQQTSELAARFDAGASRFVAVPIEFSPDDNQLFLILYGTGIRFRSDLPAVKVRIGGDACDVVFAGASPEFPGLDQVNVRLPRTLAGSGNVEVALSVDGRFANSLRIQFR